jgi:competence ComEA-like helix-hairpin-helix protein
MLSDSERRVLIFIIIVLLVGSLAGFFHPTPAERTKSPTTFPISINSATEEELILLPGIGKVMAKRIVEYRIKNKGFKTKDEITRVKGIGKIKFEKIKDKIYIEKPEEVKKITNHMNNKIKKWK